MKVCKYSTACHTSLHGDLSASFPVAAFLQTLALCCAIADGETPFPVIQSMAAHLHFSCFNRACSCCFYAAMRATPISFVLWPNSCSRTADTRPLLCSISFQWCWNPYCWEAEIFSWSISMSFLGIFWGQRVRVRWELRKQSFAYPFDICLERSVLSRKHFMWWIILLGLNVLLRTDWL